VELTGTRGRYPCSRKGVRDASLNIAFNPNAAGQFHAAGTFTDAAGEGST